MDRLVDNRMMVRLVVRWTARFLFDKYTGCPTHNRSQPDKISNYIYIYIHMLIADIPTTTRHAPCRPLWRYPVQRDSNHHDQLSTINMMGISKFTTMNGWLGVMYHVLPKNQYTWKKPSLCPATILYSLPLISGQNTETCLVQHGPSVPSW